MRSMVGDRKYGNNGYCGGNGSSIAAGLSLSFCYKIIGVTNDAKNFQGWERC